MKKESTELPVGRGNKAFGAVKTVVKKIVNVSLSIIVFLVEESEMERQLREDKAKNLARFYQFSL